MCQTNNLGFLHFTTTEPPSIIHNMTICHIQHLLQSYKVQDLQNSYNICKHRLNLTFFFRKMSSRKDLVEWKAMLYHCFLTLFCVFFVFCFVCFFLDGNLRLLHWSPWKMENIRKRGPLIVVIFLHHFHSRGSPEVLLLPPSGTGQRGIWRRPLAAPPPSRTRRWRLPGGGCRRRPDCRCRWASARATTCAGPTSRPQTTGWRRSDPRGCPGREPTTVSVGEKSNFLKTGWKLCGRALYLLLSQDEDPSGFDGVPGGEIHAGPPQHAVLVGLPLSVPGGPGNAHVVPLPIVDRQRQRHGLWTGRGRRAGAFKYRSKRWKQCGTKATRVMWAFVFFIVLKNVHSN